MPSNSFLVIYVAFHPGSATIQLFMGNCFFNGSHSHHLTLKKPDETFGFIETSWNEF